MSPDQADIQYRRRLGLIALAAILLRALWAALVPVHPVSDSSVYDLLARNLAETGAYAWDDGGLTAFWPVGTSFFYSLVYRVFGPHYEPIVVLNVLLGLGSLILIASLARRWFGKRAALFAAAIYGLWPSQIQFTTVLASELLFNFLILCALWIALEAKARSPILRGLGAGLILAAAAFVRPQALLLPILLALGHIWRRRGTPLQSGVLAAAAFATMAICIAPWSMRNTQVFGHFVLISANGGVVSWMGNHPGSTGTYVDPPPDVMSLPNEAVRNDVLGERARDHIVSHPLEFVAGTVVKLVRTHDRETIGIAWNYPSLQQVLPARGLTALKAVSTLYWLAVLLLAMAGALLVLRQQKWRALLHPALLLWAYFAVVHAITLAQDRYHFPSIPYIAMLAGLTLASLRHRFERGKEGAP